MSKCSSSCAEKHVERRADSVKRISDSDAKRFTLNAQRALPGFKSCVPDSAGPSSAICRPSSGPILVRLRAATRPAMIQAAPGKWIANPEKPTPDAGRQTPDNDTTLARWAPNGDGTYSPIPFTEPMLRVNSKLLRLLGFPGQWQTLDRLGKAGFVEMLRIAPKTTLINLNSYYNHLSRCAEDPEFWSEQKKNLSEYRKSI